MKQRILWLFLFSVAMGLLEAVVVVYLRVLYYPDGFDFPLVAMDPWIGKVEFWREVATLVMLVGVGILAGRTGPQRFAGFLFAFAVWDIFYYIFLYVFLGWPQTLVTWDILFLIPGPWVGPVITPVIVALLMITLAYFLVRFNTWPMAWDWIISTFGAVVIIWAWMRDYINYMETHAPDSSVWTLSMDDAVFEGALEYVPSQFDWGIYWIGILMLIVPLGLYVRRNWVN